MLDGEPWALEYLDSFFVCRELGCLPEPGAFGDQPIRWQQAMRIISRSVALKDIVAPKCAMMGRAQDE